MEPLEQEREQREYYGRQRCLELGVQSFINSSVSSSTPTTEQVLERAQAYFNFLNRSN